MNRPQATLWSGPRPQRLFNRSQSEVEAVAAVKPFRQGSRAGHGVNPHPRATRRYLLRSYVFCEHCGRRMCGTTRREGHSYYACHDSMWGISCEATNRARYSNSCAIRSTVKSTTSVDRK